MKRIKQTYIAFIDRWTAKSPIFWKKAQTLAITLGTSAASLIGADKLFELQSYGVPLIVFTIAGYVIAGCATLGLAAKLTKE